MTYRLCYDMRWGVGKGSHVRKGLALTIEARNDGEAMLKAACRINRDLIAATSRFAARNLQVTWLSVAEVPE